VAPFTPWADIPETQTLAAYLENQQTIGQNVPYIRRILEDVRLKSEEINAAGLNTFALDIDDLSSILIYTHDLCLPDKSGNFYFQVNNAIRVQGAAERRIMMNVWGLYVHYFLKGIQKLPLFQGLGYRGIPFADEVSKQAVVELYTEHRAIQWKNIVSVATGPTALQTAQEFAVGPLGVIFIIALYSARTLGNISFFPREGEVVLSPNVRFTVTRPAYTQDDWTYIELRETDVLIY